MPTRSIFGLDSDQLKALWSMGGPEINETHPQETGKGAERPESAQTTSSVGAPIEQPGTSIGPYKLLQKIGEGGFGVVYLAEQREPMIRRVALKIIKLGMDTNNVVARFEAERQALAMMDHPHIAKVFDAGATETGRPYFVMELVKGIPITAFCDEAQLSTDERLMLFMEVCAAVQHAHQKGIIHRDLKPSNILISLREDDRPTPKIIDFGIAKAVQHRLTEKTLFTEFRQMIGTPAYMSPEQAQFSGLDTDTRSDIYSLGVLLYELLTGKTPFDPTELLSAGYEEMCRRIREEEPPKPSSRWSTLTNAEQASEAKTRRSDPAALRRVLRGDLDWIVMKAMEKDRRRRYDTANSLRIDVQRFLDSEPVMAVAPSVLYRLRKFARRNRATLAAVMAITAALVVGTVVASWQAYVANAERVTADLAKTEAIVARNEAVDARNEAVDAKNSADEQARRAEDEELWARQIAYTADMNLAAQALKRNNMRLARELLNRNRPSEGETDLRNWEWRALWQHCEGDALSTFGDSEHVIWSASLSPDGKWLATGSLKGKISVWDIQTRKQTTTLSPQIESGQELGRVAFSQQGDRLFASTKGGVVKVWKVLDWSLTELRFPHGDRVRSISLSQDGKLLAVLGFDEKVSVWDVDEPSKPKTLHVGWGGGIQAGAVAISPDRKWLAVGLGDGSIPMFDLSTLTEQFRFPTTVKSEEIKTLAFSPDSQVLASGTGFADGAIDVWSIHEPEKPIHRLEGHTDYLCSLVFSPDGKLLASASADQTIRLWDTEEWENSLVLRGHQHEVWAVCFTSDGRQLVSGGKDGDICEWNVDRAAKMSWPIALPWGFQGLDAKRRASFSPDSLWLATRNEDGTICLRTTENLEVTHRLDELGTNHTGLLFAPERRLLFVGKDDGTLTWLDPLQPHTRKSHTLVPKATIYLANFGRKGNDLLVLATHHPSSFSPENRKTRCILWSVEDEKEIVSWDIPANQQCAALSPDGELVVTGHYDGTLRFWPIDDTGNSKAISLRDYVRGVAFSPRDDGLLVTVTEYGRIELWDVATRTSRGILHGNMKAVFEVQFSPDGTRLATAGSAGESVKLWDLATRQEVATLIAPGYSFGEVKFSPDGNAIVAPSIDGTLFMWRVPSREYITRYERSHAKSR